MSRRNVTTKEVEKNVQYLLDNMNGNIDYLDEYITLLDNPVTSDDNTTVTITHSIANARELVVEVGYYEESVGEGYTHINSFTFSKHTLDRIRSNYNNSTIGAIDLYILADNSNDGYWCTWMLDFLSDTSFKIMQKIVKGFSPSSKCAIIGMYIK